MPVVGRHGQVLVDHPAALVEAKAHDGAASERERDDDGAEPVGQVAGEPGVRVAVGVEDGVDDADPAARVADVGASSLGRNCATARSTETRSSV